MNVIAFLRDVGTNFRLRQMLSKDSVKERLNASDEGMSYTEFTYQIFQGYDFLRLRQLHNCRLQLGGSDQWGNIASGCELIRRVLGEEAFGATIPLLVDSKGNKMGKSNGGTATVWLDPAKTSPFEMYQYLVNLPDEDVENCLLKMTFKTLEEISDIVRRHAQRPEDRFGQKELARTVVEMAHGKNAVSQVQQQSSAFFAVDDIHQLTKEQFEQHFATSTRTKI